MSYNAGKGINNAMQGAQIGGSLGGVWGAAGGAILGLLTGGNSREVAMTKKYNDQVVKFAAQDLFDLRRQQNVQNIRTAQALASYKTNQKVQNSSIVASLGAADIMGSSAKALIQTLDFQTTEAQAEVMLNWQADLDNYNTTVNQMTDQRKASLKSQNGEAAIDVGALVSGAVGIYNKHGKGQGAAMVADVRDAWNDRRYLGDDIRTGSIRAGQTVMGAFKNIWTESSSLMTTTSPK